MSMVQINWRPDRRELRNFGFAILIGFALIGTVKGFWPFAWGFAPSRTFALVCYAIAVVVGALGISGTKAALPVYWLWMGVAFVIGNIIGRLSLVIFFYLVITPLGLLMRLVGRDKLMLRRGQHATYWQAVPAAPAKHRYERQF